MKHIVGSWQDAKGNRAASGELHLRLNQDALILTVAQAAPREVNFPLDKNGALMPGAEVWANDELLPDGTYYTSTVTAIGGGLIWGPQWFVIAGTDPVNLSSIVPVRVIPPVNQFAAQAGVINTFNVSSENVFGQPQPGQLVMIQTFAFRSAFPTNFANPTSYATAGLAATAPAVYVVTLNGANVGTVTFSPSGPATFQTGGFVANPGDRMTMIAPEPMDRTLSDVAISLAYTRF